MILVNTTCHTTIKVKIAKAQKDSHTHTCVTVLFPIYTLPSPKNNAYDLFVCDCCLCCGYYFIRFLNIRR